MWDPRSHIALYRLRDSARHRPEDSLTCAAWDEAGAALVAAGSRLRVWPNSAEWAGVEPPRLARHEADLVAAVGGHEGTHAAVRRCDGVCV